MNIIQPTMSVPLTIGVALIVLILLFIAYKTVVYMNKQNVVQAPSGNQHKELSEEERIGEELAALSMALHEMQEEEVHDIEETVLTITRVKRSYSPWSSKIYTLREIPHRK